MLVVQLQEEGNPSNSSMSHLLILINVRDVHNYQFVSFFLLQT